MRTIAVSILLLWCLALATMGCSGITISEECQARIDACLEQCPPNTIGETYEGGYIETDDLRTQCEQRCYDLCY